ncbi:MAG: hypothetical protein HUU10_02585 [Bacteroidetes bacterium]|nr:hypothetical protein [Bacteroidota bacterium]
MPAVHRPPDLGQLQTGADLIYQTRFNEARQIFQTYQKNHPDQPEGYFMESMVFWWKVLLSRQTGEWDQTFLDEMDQTIAQLERLMELNPDKEASIRFYLAGCYGFKARLAAQKEEWIEAATNGLHAYPILTDLLQSTPFPDARLGTGIFLYYASWVPERFPFLSRFLFFLPPADRERGLSDLTIAAREGTLTQFEASYFLLQIYMDWQPDPKKALILSDSLFRRFPSNPLFHQQHAITLGKNRKLSESRAMFAEMIRLAASPGWYQSFLSPRFWYEYGMVLQADGAWSEAIQSFSKSMNLYKNRPQLPMKTWYLRSMLETGRYLTLKGHQNEAVLLWEQVADEASGSLREEAISLLKRQKESFAQ